MSKGRALVLISVALLAVGLAALLYSGIVPWPLDAQPKSYVSRMYVVSFVWENGLKDLRLLDEKTKAEESDPKLRAVAMKEATEVVPQIVPWTRLKKAEGQFYLSLQGYEEPYLVSWRRPKITKPDLERFMSAAQLWDFQWIKEQVASGTDVNARRPHTGRTALMWASRNPDPSMVEFLLAAGANPNEKDAEGQTPLMYANAATAELLLAAGADLNATDNDGDTPLAHVLWQNDEELVKFLIDAGAAVNTSNEEGFTALMRSARWATVEIVKHLVDAGADVNARDNEGRTALFYASRIRKPTPAQKAVIDLLEKAGARE